MALNLAIGAALTGLSALSGLFGKQKQESTTTYDRSTMPQYDPTQLALRDYLIGKFKGGLEDNGEFDTAYRTAGLQQIADNARHAYTAVDDLLTGRGLGRTSAGVGSLRDTMYNAGRQSADFINNATIALDQRKQAKLSDLAGFFSALPVGNKQTGTDKTVGSTAPSSPWAGLIGGASQGLAGYLGQWYANNSLEKILKGSGGGSQAWSGATGVPSYKG